VLKNILISALVAVFVTVGGIYLYDDLYAPKVYYVDIQTFMKNVSKAYVEKKITKSEMTKEVELFANWLKKQPNNRVVFAVDSVVAGGRKLVWKNSQHGNGEN